MKGECEEHGEGANCPPAGAGPTPRTWDPTKLVLPLSGADSAAADCQPVCHSGWPVDWFPPQPSAGSACTLVSWESTEL